MLKRLFTAEVKLTSINKNNSDWQHWPCKWEPTSAGVNIKFNYHSDFGSDRNDNNNHKSNKKQQNQFVKNNKLNNKIVPKLVL